MLTFNAPRLAKCENQCHRYIHNDQHHFHSRIMSRNSHFNKGSDHHYRRRCCDPIVFFCSV